MSAYAVPNRSTTRTSMIGRRRLNVIFQKIRHSLAPSTRADSYSSLGIVERPAR